MSSPSNYNPPDNFYEYSGSGNADFPENPEDWFLEKGAISCNWDGYEKRSSQTEMIKDSFEAFSEGYILAAEAGTGLGKSLAYLSSGFLTAKQKETALVVSTYTKNLQSQLFTEDIPKLSTAIDQNLNAVIYKGRYNYICRTRLERLLSNHQHLLKPHEYENLLPILVWEWETKSGDINECSGFQMSRQKRIWSLIRSERGFCSSKRCKKYDGCFLGKVRTKVEGADIIIINHALFANELLRDTSCLPSDFIYVIDEAHHFASAIRDQLVTQVGVKSFDDVFNFFKSDKDSWKPNVLNFTRKFLDSGLKDRAITRDIQWGIDVPIQGFENKRIYVWFEAVIGYLSASKEWSSNRGESDRWREWWDNPDAKSYYFIGKDNIPFHSIIWPAILMGFSDLNLPYDIPANEFLTMQGDQLSTSRNWAVWVPDFLERYEADPLRYYLSINMPETSDSDFTWDDFVRRNNDVLFSLPTQLGTF